MSKYCRKIADYDEDRFGDLRDRLKVHDDSKFESPEYEPYIWITWSYKCKDDGVDFDAPEELDKMMNEATLHHVTSNSHHPEYHSPKKTGLINRKDRDKPPSEMVDATSMPDIDLAEMVADWCGMGEEKGNTAKSWADKNVNVRWETKGERTMFKKIAKKGLQTS